MSKFLSCFSVLLILLALVGCTRNDAQREFEQEAYQGPDGNITERDFQGKIISVDENDWRTSPLYQGLVRVNPPFPNPVKLSQQIEFEIEITGFQSVSRLEVRNRLQNGSFDLLYQTIEAPGEGLLTFQINPLELSWDGNNNPDGARGYSRIYIFDARGQMISYGDIMVE